jgi:hypothetical protein
VVAASELRVGDRFRLGGIVRQVYSLRHLNDTVAGIYEVEVVTQGGTVLIVDRNRTFQREGGE